MGDNHGDLSGTMFWNNRTHKREHFFELLSAIVGAYRRQWLLIAVGICSIFATDLYFGRTN